MRGLGYRPDPSKADGERADFDARERLKAAPLPPSANNRQLVLGVLDQGGLGSCVAHATLQAVRASQVKQGAAAPPLASRLMLYWLARAHTGETEIDAGTHIRLAFQSLNKFGFCPETHWPYTDRGDQWRTKPANEAFHAAHDQRAKTTAPVAYFRIYEDGAARALAVKQALAAGFLVVFGTDVSDRFCEGKIGVGPFDPSVGTIAGGHAMCCVGYDGDNDFDVVNSWGTGWGFGGFWRASRESLDAWRDVWIVEAAPLYSGSAA